VAIDDPDADPATADLRDSRETFSGVERRLVAYRRELGARWAVAPRMSIGFLAWYSNDEDVLRYEAVKANRLARQVEEELVERLLDLSAGPHGNNGQTLFIVVDGQVPLAPTRVRHASYDERDTIVTRARSILGFVKRLVGPRRMEVDEPSLRLQRRRNESDEA